MRIVVTGGAGYIGSVVAEELINDGHEVIVYDNLAKGHRHSVPSEAQFIKADLNDGKTLRQLFAEQRTEAVIHMAADSLVGESVTNPAKYYRNNFVAGLNLLDAMRDCDVQEIVFSSTAAIYGEPAKQPIEENDPTTPTNPYGQSKLAFEQALQWYEKAYGIRYACLRYFNAAGATQQCGEHHEPETHLIPIILQVALRARPHLEIYGDDYPTRDGTCVRDYIHVVDLAQAHIRALYLLAHRSDVFNLGCGDGYTVREVIEVAQKITGRDIKVRVGPRREGDPAVLVASSEKIKRELGWEPQKQALSSIVESAWLWMQKHPCGYEE
jgi:UDP-glucose 4-epimerase